MDTTVRIGTSDDEYEDANILVAVITDEDVQDDPEIPSEDEGKEPPDDPVMPDNILSASQCATVALFDGTVGPDAERFIDQLNRAKTAYGWTEAQAAAAAQQRMTGLAAAWLQHNERLGLTFTAWTGENRLKQAIKERFVAGRTLAASIGGLAELQQGQKSTERVVEFVERLSAALDKKNFDVSDTDKAGEDYRTAFEKELLKYVLHGLREDLKPRVIGVPQAPEDLAGVMQVCMRAEAEQMSELQVQAVQSKQGEDPEINTVQRQFGRMNPPSYQRNQCSNCRGYGHYSRECPSSQWRGNQPARGKPATGTRHQTRDPSQNNRRRNGRGSGPARGGRQRFPYTSGATQPHGATPDRAQYQEFLDWKKTAQRNTQEIQASSTDMPSPAYWGTEAGNEEGDRA